MFKKTKLILRAFFVMAVIVWAASPSFAADKPSKTTKSSKPSNTEKADTQKPIKRIDTMIAVFDLEITEGVTKGISRPLSESIRREIVMSGRYEVIDRGNMNKILGEQKFQLSGCAAGECIVEAGQLLGVGKIVTGSIGLVGKTYYLSLSVINVETGKIENVSEDKCECRLDDLIDSSKRLVKKLLGEQIAETKSATETKEPSEQKPVIASETSSPADPTERGKQSQQPPSSPFPKGEYTDSSGIEMVFVRGGCYQMGDTFGDGSSDEKPVHKVCVDDFYIGKYEVTQGQWKAIMGNNPSSFSSCVDNCPVENVSWNDIQDFINKLNQKTGKNYRLPAEAEWEYAARSGGKSEKYSGNNDIDSVAWYTSNSGSKTHPVGQKAANGLGIYDMSGNVLEWVSDWHGDKYYSKSPKNNPKGPNSGSLRVLRGGSWGYSVRSARTANRDWSYPGSRLRDVGFRVAMTQ
ncbi:MAG: SUMF1/EgtB/PvdO family nonheme iron enzyme [Thermodesulfovibrionales bacterium]|nr:SUMF1/EgtB/PvdO family nonheme iron enzyme [Thermodesulfovibrionales bacterium]